MLLIMIAEIVKRFIDLLLFSMTCIVKLIIYVVCLLSFVWFVHFSYSNISNWLLYTPESKYEEQLVEKAQSVLGLLFDSQAYKVYCSVTFRDRIESVKKITLTPEVYEKSIISTEFGKIDVGQGQSRVRGSSVDADVGVVSEMDTTSELPGMSFFRNSDIDSSVNGMLSMNSDTSSSNLSMMV